MSDKVGDRIAESVTRLLGGNYGMSSLASSEGAEARRDRLNHRLASLELRRQTNIETVVQMAFDAASEEDVIVPAPDVDDDWLTRLISHAQDVSNPVTQAVWAEVLARETQSPGRFSLRALDTLGGMTAEDWGTWIRASRLCFPTGYLLKLGQRNEFDEFDLGVTEIQRLQTLDMIQPTDDLSVTFYAPSKGLTFDFKGADLVVRHPESTLFTLPAYRISGAAMELFRQLEPEPADMEYLEALGQALRGEGYDFRLRPSTSEASAA